MPNGLNINRLLESNRRSDVRGYNIYTCGKENLKRSGEINRLLEKWDKPRLGLNGVAAIGHEIDKKDLVIPIISVNGAALDFDMIRHRWTPAYMDTYYRCLPFGEYQASGLFAVRERKCFTEEDTFISHLTLFNDGHENMQVELSMSVPFELIDDGVYSASAEVRPKSLSKKIFLEGFVCAKTDRGTKATLTLPPLSKLELRYGFAFSAKSRTDADEALNRALNVSDPFSEAEKRFNAWMEKHAPALSIDNYDILKVYYYRFFVIKSAIHEPSLVLPDSDFTGKCVYESPFGGWFGAPVGLPIPLQIEEMKWMKSTGALRSQIANWCRGVGITRDYIQFTPMAIWNAYTLIGDKSLVSEFYQQIKEYTLKKASDDESELPVTKGSWVTGAEYQPAFYQHTEPSWDWRCDTEGVKDGFEKTRLHRLDECVMYAANLRACEKMAVLLGLSEDASTLASRGKAALESIKQLCWNDEKQFFFDVDIASGKQCDEAYGYDGFMPMMFSLFGKEYHGIFEKLSESGPFTCGFAITSVGKDCPMYWFDNCIVGPTAASLSAPHPYGCSWNGPVWPYAVSLVLKSLGSASYSNHALADTFRRIFNEYTDLHFDYGDRSTPCICEHYRPTDALSFSQYTEYFHSEWINLLISYYLGVSISDEQINFAPLTTEEFELNGVVIRGKTYDFAQKNIDGKLICKITEY